MHLTHPKYRPDIDGLRAIAILSVIGFHAFPTIFKGGFIGVDIFFVISGYLITTIILENLYLNNFSLLEFYARRIKRIFPALLTVMLFSLTIGYFILTPDELQQLGKHITGGAFFISNFILWNESGYFDNAAYTKPLLHLWSLGVEEQFYIIFPLLLLAAYKLRTNLLLIIIFFCIASFSVNMWVSQVDLIADFYSPWTRFWELMVGAILASSLTSNNSGLSPTLKLKTDFLQNILPFFGMFLLILGFLIITSDKAFPGYLALLPTIGTALLIAGGSQAWVNRFLLSNKVLIWFGLISFPLYLWHWVLLSYAYIIEGKTPALEIRIGAVFIAILLAWLTYKIIEKPLRFGKNNTIILSSLIILMIGISLVGYFVHSKTYSKSENLQEINQGGTTFHLDYLKKHYFPCTPNHIYNAALQNNGEKVCYQSKPDSSVDLAIVGDSHAEHLFVGLAEALPHKNVVFYMRTGYPGYYSEYAPIIHYLRDTPNIKSIIISGYWAQSTGATSNLVAGLKGAILELSKTDRQIYITDDIPNFEFDPKKCKYGRRLGQVRETTICSEPSERFDKQYEEYYPELILAQKEYPKVKVMNTSKYFRKDEHCFMAENGLLYYRDNNHLNLNGSRYVGKMLVKDFPEIAQ